MLIHTFHTEIPIDSFNSHICISKPQESLLVIQYRRISFLRNLMYGKVYYYISGSCCSLNYNFYIFLVFYTGWPLLWSSSLLIALDFTSLWSNPLFLLVILELLSFLLNTISIFISYFLFLSTFSFSSFLHFFFPNYNFLCNKYSNAKIFQDPLLNLRWYSKRNYGLFIYPLSLSACRSRQDDKFSLRSQ